MFNLYCIPYAGASGYVYQKWSQYLPKNFRLKIYHPPGHGQRFGELLPESVDEVVQDFFEQHSNTDGINILFGHSLGAVIAYELARKFKKTKNFRADMLIVSGRRAPFLDALTPKISALNDNDFIARLKSYQATPDEVLEHDDFKELFLPAIRNDFRMSESHYAASSRSLNLPIVAYCGTDDPYAPEHAVLKWHEMTRKTFMLEKFNGDHFFLNACPETVIRSIVKNVESEFKNRFF